ncbi:MAG: hypothetical protein ACSW8F_00260, partial [bacterium]
MKRKLVLSLSLILTLALLMSTAAFAVGGSGTESDPWVFDSTAFTSSQYTNVNGKMYITSATNQNTYVQYSGSTITNVVIGGNNYVTFNTKLNAELQGGSLTVNASGANVTSSND